MNFGSWIKVLIELEKLKLLPFSPHSICTFRKSVQKIYEASFWNTLFKMRKSTAMNKSHGSWHFLKIMLLLFLIICYWRENNSFHRLCKVISCTNGRITLNTWCWNLSSRMTLMLFYKVWIFTSCRTSTLFCFCKYKILKENLENGIAVAWALILHNIFKAFLAFLSPGYPIFWRGCSPLMLSLILL